MKLYFIILLFLYISISHAQLSSYQKEIYAAENLILQKNYSAALSSYNLSFDLTNTPKYKDLHNALICSYLTQDTISFSKIAYRIGNLCNTPASEIRSNYYKVYLSPYFYDVLVDQIVENPLDSLNIFLSKLHTLDQGLRNQCGLEKTCFHVRDEIDKLDSLNLKLVYKFITDNSNQEGLSIYDCMHQMPLNAMMLIVLHNTNSQINSISEFLKDSIFPALLDLAAKEYIDPDIVAWMYDRFAMNKDISTKFGLNSVIIKENRLFCIPMEKICPEIDSNRAAVGLEPYKILHEKIAFQLFENKMFNLVDSHFLWETPLDINEVLNVFGKYEVKQ